MGGRLRGSLCLWLVRCRRGQNCRRDIEKIEIWKDKDIEK